MTDFTFSRPTIFPEGTDLEVYPASALGPRRAGGEPWAALGDPADTATVSSGEAAFTGLDEEPHYVVGDVTGDGDWRWVQISPGADQPGGTYEIGKVHGLQDALDAKLPIGLWVPVVPPRTGVVTDTASTAATRVIQPNSTTVPLAASHPSPQGVFYFDPADYDGGADFDLEMRLRALVFTNGTAPGITFTFGLRPVSAVGGGADLSSCTLDTAVTDSTVAIATPALNTRNRSDASFAAPAAGWYALSVDQSGGMAADSVVNIAVSVSVRNVAAA